MRALRYLAPNRLEVEDVPTPKPKTGEYLLRVRACGICGSDVHGATGRTGRRIPPMTMGHEFSAEIAEAGEGAVKFQVGDGVVPQPIDFCGTCSSCRIGLTQLCLNKRFFGVMDVDGAFAEYISVPEKLLYPLPAGMTYERGALVEPYAVTYGAYRTAAARGSLKDQIILIIGAGTIGDCLLQMVLLEEPKQVIMADLSDARLAMAKRLGATDTVNTGKVDALEEIARLTDGHMIDVSFECCGVEATANLSVKALKTAGEAFWVGNDQSTMTLNMQDIVCSARSVTGIYTYTHKQFGETVDLIGSGRIDSDRLISKVVSLEEAPQAFRDLIDHPDDYLKIIVDPTR